MNENMKPVYDDLYLDTSYAKGVNSNQFDWLMGRDLKEVLTAIDFGCGTGHIVRALRKRGIDATGVDFSTSLETRDWMGDDKFVCGDVRTADLGVKADLVVCHDVLEHLTEADAPVALDNLAKHTGKFASIAIANHSDVWNGHELHLNNKPIGWWKPLLEERWHVLEAESRINGWLHLFWCQAK